MNMSKSKVHEIRWASVLVMSGIFGTLGIHRFYMGKPFTGLFYLFTFGVFFIGYLIDFIRIMCVDESILKKNQKWVGKPIDSVKVLPDGSKKMVLNYIGMIGASFYMIDRFFMGPKHRIPAIIKVSTLGGFLVWWLVDFIRILSKRTFNDTIEWKS